jgi:hypothetical protein
MTGIHDSDSDTVTVAREKLKAVNFTTNMGCSHSDSGCSESHPPARIRVGTAIKLYICFYFSQFMNLYQNIVQSLAPGTSSIDARVSKGIES